MSHHDPSFNTDIAAGAIGASAGVAGVMDLLHFGLSWFILVGSAILIAWRLYDRIKKHKKDSST